MTKSKRITIGGNPYTVAKTRRMAFRLGKYPSFAKEKDDTRRACIMIYAAITERIDDIGLDAEEIAALATDAELSHAVNAVAEVMSAEEADADPLSASGRSSSGAAG
jgi:hypothetical protein